MLQEQINGSSVLMEKPCFNWMVHLGGSWPIQSPLRGNWSPAEPTTGMIWSWSPNPLTSIYGAMTPAGSIRSATFFHFHSGGFLLCKEATINVPPDAKPEEEDLSPLTLSWTERVAAARAVLYYVAVYVTVTAEVSSSDWLTIYLL